MKLQKLISLELDVQDVDTAVYLFIKAKKDALAARISTTEKLPSTCHADLEEAKAEYDELCNVLAHMGAHRWECNWGVDNGTPYFYVMIDDIYEEKAIPSDKMRKNLLFDLHHEQGKETGTCESPTWITNILKEE